MLGALGSKQDVTLGDVFNLDRSNFGKFEQIFSTFVVVALSVIISLIIGSTTASRPQVEYQLKGSRALWLVVAAIGTGLFSTASNGIIGIGRSQAFQDASYGSVETLRDIGTLVAATNHTEPPWSQPLAGQGSPNRSSQDASHIWNALSYAGYM